MFRFITLTALMALTACASTQNPIKSEEYRLAASSCRLESATSYVECLNEAQAPLMVEDNAMLWVRIKSARRELGKAAETGEISLITFRGMMEDIDLYAAGMIDEENKGRKRRMAEAWGQIGQDLQERQHQQRVIDAMNNNADATRDAGSDISNAIRGY